jgi:DNA-binding GntR family transcriptional regulator
MQAKDAELLDRADPTPLYQQIVGVIRGRILSGQWPRHYKLKAEDDLAEQFGVSRGTMRQALRALVEEGLLTQRHGRGTFVTARDKDLPLAQRLVTMHEVLSATGRPFQTEVLEREVGRGPNNVRALLDLPEGENLLRLRRRLIVEGEPLAVLDNFVRLDLCPRLEQVDFSQNPLFEAVEKLCEQGIGWGQRTFAATRAGDMAATLEAEPGEPVLYLEQITYLTDGTALEYSDVWVRGEKLQVTTILSRNVAGPPDSAEQAL